MGTVTIVEPDPGWASEFVRLAGRIGEVLEGCAIRIDHIGSTSVDGLASKDVIDIQVTVADAGALDEAAERLARGGWPLWADITRDHPVVGHPPDREQWTKRLAHEPAGERRANVHVRIDGRPNQRYALLFRDFLRAHPETAAVYGEFKRRAAAMIRDPDDYPDLKDPVCDLVYLPAQQWAASTNWRP